LAGFARGGRFPPVGWPVAHETPSLPRHWQVVVIVDGLLHFCFSDRGAFAHVWRLVVLAGLGGCVEDASSPLSGRLFPTLGPVRGPFVQPMLFRPEDFPRLPFCRNDVPNHHRCGPFRASGPVSSPPFTRFFVCLAFLVLHRVLTPPADAMTPPSGSNVGNNCRPNHLLFSPLDFCFLPGIVLGGSFFRPFFVIGFCGGVIPCWDEDLEASPWGPETAPVRWPESPFFHCFIWRSRLRRSPFGGNQFFGPPDSP